MLAAACSPWFVACGDGSADGSGAGGSSSGSDDRYVIEDASEDCDDVEGLQAEAILEAVGLEFEGEISWTDLETGYEASRSNVHVTVSIDDGGTITCIPFRHLPGQPPEYARLSYDAVTLSMVSDDGLLNEVGDAVAWLSESEDDGMLFLDVVRALPVADSVGAFEVSPVLGSQYENLVLVYSPSEETPSGHVSVASESIMEVQGDGRVNVGVPHGFFPTIPD